MSLLKVESLSKSFASGGMWSGVRQDNSSRRCRHVLEEALAIICSDRAHLVLLSG